MTQSSPTVLVIGATGGFGGAVTQALLKHGWRVRALARNPAKARAALGERTAIEWVKGDAMEPGDVLAAARGCEVIVHGANPPGYRNWAGTVLPMARASIAAAKAVGAMILVPASVYNFAPEAGPAIGEDAPQAPVTRKGKIRVQLEQELKVSGVKALVLRAGDFFGPGVGGNGALGWLTLRMKRRVRAVFAPGRTDLGHAFAYLPDLGEAAARLLEKRAELRHYEVVHFRGHFETVGALSHAVRAAAPGAVSAPFPWALVTGLSPFDETVRELREMRYLWKKPIGLANGRLVQLIGEEPHTPFARAIAASVAHLETEAAPAPVTSPAGFASAR
jgi:nucleoside-diphosphate-sugar epimerase